MELSNQIWLRCDAASVPFEEGSLKWVNNLDNQQTNVWIAKRDSQIEEGAYVCVSVWVSVCVSVSKKGRDSASKKVIEIE